MHLPNRPRTKTPRRGPRCRSHAQLKSPPRTAAVVLTLREGTQTTYAALLAKARANIKLAEIGLESVKVKTTMTGSRLMEMTGEEPEKLADLLAEKLRSLAWTKPWLDEVAAAIAAKGGCPPEQVKVGEIRTSLWGQCSALIRCPAAAAKVIANFRKVTVGWNTATITPVQALPMRCYRYMNFATFAESASSMGHYGWLMGDQKPSHIMEPYERVPGFG
ncbi:hypothetical protein MSG28_015938 [Choristoneura fumiferana]|uniref:Uncharacterized protein n=1 Tax=Choristoneura fumiferana TaxID=7141 RepID=A0ACC0K580_CHOFU|nr:hypothetical protein MSG28_015938 [Choristoneura fumiferana]